MDLNDFLSVVDVAEAADLTAGVQPGEYPGLVFDLTVESGKKNPDERYMVFKYALNDVEGYTPQEWFLLPQGSPSSWTDETYPNRKSSIKDTYEQARSRIKNRLKSLGIPTDRMNSITPDQVVGTPVLVTMGKDRNSEFSRVAKVVVITDEPNPVELPTAKDSPAAAAIDNPFKKK